MKTSHKPKIEIGLTESKAPEKLTVLQEAHSIVHGNREQIYGHPSKNVKAIMRYWNAHLTNVLGEDIEITEADVCAMLRLVKQARLDNDPTHHDSLVDLAGYVAVQDRCNQ